MGSFRIWKSNKCWNKWCEPNKTPFLPTMEFCHERGNRRPLSVRAERNRNSTTRSHNSWVLETCWDWNYRWQKEKRKIVNWYAVAFQINTAVFTNGVREFCKFTMGQGLSSLELKLIPWLPHHTPCQTRQGFNSPMK